MFFENLYTGIIGMHILYKDTDFLYKEIQLKY